ncbi:hypothetical protein JCM3766R1_004194 [Sporobolomyces carnicolor]
MSLDLPEDPLPTAEHGEHSLDDRGTGGGEDTVPPRRSSSPTVDPPTWQAQLTAARAEIAHRVQKQLEDDGWDTSEPTRDVAEMTMPRTQHSADRRASIATDDGDEDLLIAEMLRPRSRPRTPAEEEPTSCDDPVTSDSAPSRSAGDTTSDKICRICFDSEDDALGRLFSPCRCRGSSRYVHKECLAAWRKAAQNSSSFYRCETCTYEYRFRRTFVGNVINSRFSVFTLTIIAFLVLTWIAGFLANSLLSVVESRSTAWHGTAFDDFFVADHILLGEGVRESLSFVTHQLEGSRWSTARKIAYQAQLQEQARLNVDAGFLARVALHFTKGTALLGLLSVFYTYIAATFVSPLGRTLFRAIRPAGGRRRAGDNSASMGQIIIVIVVLVGIARAVRQVYRGVRWVSRRILTRLEDLVLEVN